MEYSLSKTSIDIIVLYLNGFVVILCYHKVRQIYAKILGKDLK